MTELLERSRLWLQRTAISMLVFLLLAVSAAIAPLASPLQSPPAQQTHSPPSFFIWPLVQRIFLPASAVSIEEILQLPELPNGCEGTALTILLRHHGLPADKTEIAVEYIPRTPLLDTWHGSYASSPESSYAGDPRGAGYYCFVPPVRQAANRCIAQQQAKLHAHDLTGCSILQLRQSILSGNPIAAWTTLNFDEPRYSRRSWKLLDSGKRYRPYANLHCVIVYGYDPFYYYIFDPLIGKRTVSAAAFEASWLQMGRRAFTISRKGAPPLGYSALSFDS